MKIVFSKRCLEFKKKNHPESPDRVLDCFNLLRQRGLQFYEPPLASEDDLLLVHSRKLLEEVKTGNFSDPDTPVLDNIFEYARLSAGAAILACELALLDGVCFSLMRPPGHHASREHLGGFCYFNNIAIAVEKMRLAKKRIAIIDFDCHHGNGTQDIFLGKDNVLYVSLHQSPLYPGTGLKDENNCFNFPLEAGTDEYRYLQFFRKALEIVAKFNPDLLAVSCGFDTYRRDPLGGINLDTTSFKKIGELIISLNKPLFAVLEGGYSSRLALCLDEFLSGLNREA